MIMTRSPLRISLGGGGTDLPSYYGGHGGFLIAAAINKYVYTTVMRPFSPGIYLKYSSLESVKSIEEIQHPIIREVLREINPRTPQIEITSLADIPAGTGLGSSSSFTTALLKALYSHYRRNLHPQQLAELACKIEIEKLKEPIGKQDQYIAAYGGINTFTFKQNGEVEVHPLQITTETLHNLEDNLLLFFTGVSRTASSILSDQDTKSRASDLSMLDNLHYIKDLGFRSREALESSNLRSFGELMGEHWEHKKSRSEGISSPLINDAYQIAMKNGAIGGKLVGAGGGGFLMFYATDKERLRGAMRKIKLEEVRFQFDFEGTKVILS
jgi:D-glycero-alpha-D-manno-heptose-7-phosphate kinase